MDYEEALRIDTGKWYATSANLVWMIEKDELNKAYRVFERGKILYAKIGPKHDLNEIEKIIFKLNPKDSHIYYYKIWFRGILKN